MTYTHSLLDDASPPVLGYAPPGARRRTPMKHFLKVMERVDVRSLADQLDLHPELWDQHKIRKEAPGTPHSQMSDIWVRFNDVAPFDLSGDYSKFSDPHVPVWYPAWDALPALKPIVFDLMAKVRGEMLGGVLITRIPPGAGIDPHRDKSWHVDYFDKFYLSIRSAPGAMFGCEHDGVRELLNPIPGDIWRFDNRKLHWVHNGSTQDRITLIICIRTDRYREFGLS